MRNHLLSLLALAGAALAVIPATASADVEFGSDLSRPAGLPPYQRHGWDQNVWNLTPDGAARAPREGLVKQVKLKGFAPDGPLEIKFRVIREVKPGQWTGISTPFIATLPGPDSANENSVHTYTVPDNGRPMRVRAGDMVGVFQQGNGGAGTPWAIFAPNPAFTFQKVAVNDGFKDNDLSTSPPVDKEGDSNVTYPGNEVLLRAVLSEDLCPGTDLPQLTCQSKLYLGGKVKKGGAFKYEWTLRNGGPHPAAGVGFRVNLPRGTEVIAGSLPEGCETTVGPPLAIVCNVGEIPPPQLGNAVRKLAFAIVPKKRTSFFRATGQIEAPNVVDPQGDSRHFKTVSASTRFLR